MGLASPCPRGWERKLGHTGASNKGEPDIQKAEGNRLRWRGLWPDHSGPSHPTSARSGFCVAGFRFSTGPSGLTPTQPSRREWCGEGGNAISTYP